MFHSKFSSLVSLPFWIPHMYIHNFEFEIYYWWYLFKAHSHYIQRWTPSRWKATQPQQHQLAALPFTATKARIPLVLTSVSARIHEDNFWHTWLVEPPDNENQPNATKNDPSGLWLLSGFKVKACYIDVFFSPQTEAAALNSILMYIKYWEKLAVV